MSSYWQTVGVYMSSKTRLAFVEKLFLSDENVKTIFGADFPADRGFYS